MSQFLAHSWGHLLNAHLTSVADQARRFARGCNQDEFSGQWAAVAGLWHDLGKYRPGFQRYVRHAQDAHIEHKVAGREKTHSAAGALRAMRHLEQKHGAPGKLAARVLAYLIAGHHAGLADWEGDLAARLESADSAQELQEALTESHPRGQRWLCTVAVGAQHLCGTYRNAGIGC